jgi:hypothetical protein
MRLILGCFLTLLVAVQSHADFVFKLSDTNVNAGSPNVRDLFISAAPGDGFQALSYVEFNASAALGAGNSAISGFTLDGGFGTNFLYGTSSVSLSSGVLSARLYSTGTLGAPTSGNQVRLGSLAFNGGSLGNVTALTFSDPGVVSLASSGGNNAIAIVGGAGSPIDSQVFGVPQNVLNITAVPEPTSFALLSLVGVGGAAWRLRKRSRATK